MFPTLPVHMGLVVRNLRSTLLRGCDLSVADGEIVTLRGASGAGKSVLLRAIADMDPNEGDVWLDDVSRASLSGPEWRRRVRYVAAESAWWEDDVAPHFRFPDQSRPLAVELGMPDDFLSWQVARLSTGEKQRLAFVRALEDNPRALLLDEPTAALDSEAERLVEARISRLQAAGTAIILVTHSDAQAERLAAHRYLVEGGLLRETV